MLLELGAATARLRGALPCRAGASLYLQATLEDFELGQELRREQGRRHAGVVLGVSGGGAGGGSDASSLALSARSSARRRSTRPPAKASRPRPISAQEKQETPAERISTRRSLSAMLGPSLASSKA